ncbi:MAG: ComEC/Rec2 family competence protein [Prevotella sp.]|nr:ComEC/Rec2 family competence protein [Prevotella sp.]
MKTVPLLHIAICLMAGIVVGEYVHTPFPLFPIFVVSVVTALFLWRFPYVQSATVCVCMLLLGWLMMERQQGELCVEWPDSEVGYEAVVVSTPVEKKKTMALDLLLTKSGRKIKGYVYKDERSRGLQIGDGLKIQSAIKPNREWRIGTFDYKRHLEIHGFTGSTYVAGWKWQRAQVSLKDVSRRERTKLFFLKLRSRLISRLRHHEEGGDDFAVVAAMVLGDKSMLSKELREVYSVTGGAHVLALSGLHLGIIYMLLSWLIVGRRWRTLSLLVVVLGIWAFVFLVGLSTSVVRSAVMLTAYAMLSLGHRDKMSLNTLAFTAIVMLLVNPLSLFDVGFQMSFAAVGSILLFLPLFDDIVPRRLVLDRPIVKWLLSMIAVSCAAQIGTAPLIAYYFGRFSTYFLLTNFIVIPAVTLILYLSIAVLAVPSLSHLLLYIAGLLNLVLGKMAVLPGASIEIRPSLLQTLLVYVVIFASYLLIRKTIQVTGWSASRKGW